MSDLRQAAIQALDALEVAQKQLAIVWESPTQEVEAAITALRAALAEPQTTHWEGCEAVHPECKEKNT